MSREWWREMQPSSWISGPPPGKLSSAPSGIGLLTPSYKQIVLTLNLGCISHIKSIDRCERMFLHCLAIAAFKSCVGMFRFVSWIHMICDYHLESSDFRYVGYRLMAETICFRLMLSCNSDHGLCHLVCMHFVYWWWRIKLLVFVLLMIYATKLHFPSFSVAAWES